jgi:hypothetical protein
VSGREAGGREDGGRQKPSGLQRIVIRLRVDTLSTGVGREGRAGVTMAGGCGQEPEEGSGPAIAARGCRPQQPQQPQQPHRPLAVAMAGPRQPAAACTGRHRHGCRAPAGWNRGGEGRRRMPRIRRRAAGCGRARARRITPVDRDAVVRRGLLGAGGRASMEARL